MNLLGGTVKLGDIVADIALEDASAQHIADILGDRIPTRSFDFGWTAITNAKPSKMKLSKLAIAFKKEIKSRGIGSRWVTAEHGAELSPAAVAKLKLTTEGLDILLFQSADRVLIGLTTDVQDADAWSLRDYGRPGRITEKGMLPPKLARMMVNLARVPHDGTLLDPFCGSGTVLMEAALATRAMKIIGSDHDARQIADTDKNNAWLLAQHILNPEDADRLRTIQCDVKKIPSHLQSDNVHCVVTEGYLGPPLRGHESLAIIKKTADDLTKLWSDTLTALHDVLAPQARIVGIWPAFKSDHGTARVDLESKLETLGYRLIDPLGDWESSGGPLVYQRPDQRVSRRIVVLEKL
jgi:tRNA G10  N-methylase Trm11